MFHYIIWRPTSVIKKHSPPSETDFYFLSKEANITPPPTKDKETVPSVRTEGASERKCPNKRCPNKRSRTKGALHQQLRQSASREAPPRRFFGLRRHQRRGDFFSRVPDVTRSRRPDFFLVVDVTKR